MGSEINSITNAMPTKAVSPKSDDVNNDANDKEVIIDFAEQEEDFDPNDDYFDAEFHKQLDAANEAAMNNIREQVKAYNEANERAEAKAEADYLAKVAQEEEYERLTKPVPLAEEDSIDGAIYRLERKVINKIKSFFK